MLLSEENNYCINKEAVRNRTAERMDGYIYIHLCVARLLPVHTLSWSFLVKKSDAHFNTIIVKQCGLFCFCSTLFQPKIDYSEIDLIPVLTRSCRLIQAAVLYTADLFPRGLPYE